MPADAFAHCAPVRDAAIHGGARTRPLVLVFTRVYLPGYRAGGPIRSIANLVARLGSEFEFRIVTSDRDYGDSRPYPGIRSGQWAQQGAGSVLYLNLHHSGLREFASIVAGTRPDAVYLNSFFDARFTRRVLWARRFGTESFPPVILAPRGEFSRGALTFKRWRKRAGMFLANKIRLYDNLTWQASTNIEADEIAAGLGAGWFARHGGRIIVASNLFGLTARGQLAGAGAIPAIAPSRSVHAPLRVCFLSRVSPKKNLDYALQVLARVHENVRFTIYGPREETYWQQCESIIGTLPANVQVEYCGPLKHDEVADALCNEDLFFLPTRGENFGHAIVEAMQAGLPVLISDQTPWRNLVATGAGWDLPLKDQAEFAKRIDSIARWSPQEFAAASACAQGLAARVADDGSSVDASRQLLLNAIGWRPSPSHDSKAKGTVS